MILLAATILLFLVLVNALYVAAEFSAVTVRRSRIRQRAEQGDWLARRLLPFLEDAQRLDRYIAACQIGITLSSLVMGAYGQAALAPVLTPLFETLGGMQQAAAQSVAALIILVGLTAFQMVLGELVPKSLALQYPTTLARWTVLPMLWSLWLLSWFIAILNGSGIAILRLLGVRQAGHRHLHSAEEIDYLIGESQQGGLFRPDEHQRLRRALRLAVLPVDEVMVPRTRIHGIKAGIPFEAVVRVAAESPFTRLPVYRGSLDKIIGFVHVLDVARHALDGVGVALEDLLRPVLVVPQGIAVERVLERLREARQHVALVVDEFGGTAGLVTVGDILDEIFGGIADEFKAPAAGPERLPDGRLRLPGSMRLEEAEVWVGAHWEGDCHTAGGLVMERLGHIPTRGEQVHINGVAVQVERVAGRVVESLLVVPVGAAEEDGDE